MLEPPPNAGAMDCWMSVVDIPKKQQGLFALMKHHRQEQCYEHFQINKPQQIAIAGVNFASHQPAALGGTATTSQTQPQLAGNQSHPQQWQR